MQRALFSLLFLLILAPCLGAPVLPGIDVLLEPENFSRLKGKKVALLTNQTAITSRMRSTLDTLKAKAGPFQLVKLFAPEHGLKGEGWAGESIAHSKESGGLPVLSLHGKNRRPTADMLKGIDLIIFDIQDIGSRSYTYATTLFYVMEEAAKHNVAVMVLDRPNPINGVLVDGPLLEEKWRSFVGWINVPYCHGMTIGELANYFNGEYKIGCSLTVIPMKGWKRSMSFDDTGLPWIPTSPNIPESDTPLYYPTTGILGELGLVSIGVGYTLPFKLVGAPWINGEKLSLTLRQLNLPGVTFRPFYFRPFAGKFAGESCEGVLIKITQPKLFKPLKTQYALIDTLKKLYPEKVKEALKNTSEAQKSMFSKVNGTEALWQKLISKEGTLSSYPLDSPALKKFKETRQKYLLYD